MEDQALTAKENSYQVNNPKMCIVYIYLPIIRLERYAVRTLEICSAV
jgi:hypothetical protein